ncbi:MAG: AsmA family protein, partial [Melioribacteraceae bacterium]
MKNLFKIVGVLFILLLIVAIAIPFLFKDEITELVKRSTNESIDATVDFADVDLSLLSSFPDLSVSINDISIINKTPFEGDTLFYAQSFDISLDIISLISGEILKVKAIHIDEPIIHTTVLEDGTANYIVTKENAENSKSSDAKFKISLQSYSITNGKIVYIDKSNNIIITMLNVNHTGEGDFTQDDFNLDTKTTSEKITYEFGGIKYLNNVKANLDMELAVNLPLFKFEFKDNKLMLN